MSVSLKAGAAVVALLAFSSCAVKTESVSLSAPAAAQPLTVMKCGDALQATLAIAPPIDKRPEYEKTGKKPTGVFLGVWNQRIGSYVTSDADFGRDVPKAMMQRFAQAIEQSNCFVALKPLTEEVPPNPVPEELLVLFAKTRARYLLTTQIEHFYGTQHQHSHLAVVPALVVNAASVSDGVGLAEGVTEVTFVLYDMQSSYEIWGEKIQAGATNSIKGGFPQAAQESLSQAAERLAKAIYTHTQSLEGR